MLQKYYVLLKQMFKFYNQIKFQIIDIFITFLSFFDITCCV